MRIEIAKAQYCIGNCVQVITELRDFDPRAYEDPPALKARQLGISEKVIRVKLAERVSAALNNISTANVRAVRRAILEDAWSARHDAPPGGFKLPYDKHRKEQQADRQAMLKKYPKWKAPSYEPSSSSQGAADSFLGYGYVDS